MADQVNANEVDMTIVEKMDSARNVLSAAAAGYMSRGAIPESGVGTVKTDEDGIQHIVGVNDGFSRIDWSSKPTRTVNGNMIQDYNKWTNGDGGVIHTKIKDSKDPKSSTDAISRMLADGEVFLQMLGQCKELDEHTEKCTYDLKSNWGAGTAEITTSKETISAEHNVWSAKSNFRVKTENGDLTAEIVYKVSNDVASYEYKDITPKK